MLAEMSDARFDGRHGRHFHLVAALSEYPGRALCGARLTEWSNMALATLAEQRVRSRPKDVPCEACLQVRDTEP